MNAYINVLLQTLGSALSSVPSVPSETQVVDYLSCLLEETCDDADGIDAQAVAARVREIREEHARRSVASMPGVSIVKDPAELALVTDLDPCPVCLTPLLDVLDGDQARVARLPCAHLLCTTCVASVVKMQPTRPQCPMCRQPVMTGT